jgi:UDP-N-acetylmuramyl pentapeptide phosphotransferase/UDP-N-acetylglucosamine-1-phosphate transferase
MIKYYLFIATCLPLFLLINFYLISIKKFLNIYDIPDYQRKIHHKKTPLIGGLIIFFFFYYFIFIDFILLDKNNFFFLEKYNFFVFTISSGALFLIGLIDDKFVLSSNKKIFLYFFIIAISLITNNQLIIENINSQFLKKNINLGSFSYLFTILAILLFLISLNMLDGVNMMSASYVIFFLIILFLKFNYIFIFLYLIFILFFFLYLNYKNKSFLGESGVIFLGYILSYFVIIAYNEKRIDNVEEIFLIMAIPGFDLLRVSLARLITLKSPLSPDNNHIHHRLLKSFRGTQVVIIILSIIFLPYSLFLIYQNILFSIILSLSLYFFTVFILPSTKLNFLNKLK